MVDHLYSVKVGHVPELRSNLRYTDVNGRRSLQYVRDCFSSGFLNSSGLSSLNLGDGRTLLKEMFHSCVEHLHFLFYVGGLSLTEDDYVMFESLAKQLPICSSWFYIHSLLQDRVDSFTSFEAGLADAEEIFYATPSELRWDFLEDVASVSAAALPNKYYISAMSTFARMLDSPALTKTHTRFLMWSVGSTMRRIVPDGEEWAINATLKQAESIVKTLLSAGNKQGLVETYFWRAVWASNIDFMKHEDAMVSLLELVGSYENTSELLAAAVTAMTKANKYHYQAIPSKFYELLSNAGAESLHTLFLQKGYPDSELFVKLCQQGACFGNIESSDLVNVVRLAKMVLRSSPYGEEVLAHYITAIVKAGLENHFMKHSEFVSLLEAVKTEHGWEEFPDMYVFSLLKLDSQETVT